ncbi:MAG: hypothetical protein JXA11_12765 [Phycisphaerae bacterium]|nr:hypothetical protein [Phycisphaerae bacterium]
MSCPWTSMPRGGLLEEIRPQLQPLPGLDETFRRWVLQFLKTCYQADDQTATFRESAAIDAPFTARSLYCGLRMLAQLGDSDLLRRVRADREKIRRTIDSYYNPELELYQGIDNHESTRVGAWRLHDGYLYLPRALKILNLPSQPIAQGLDKLPRFGWAPQMGDNLHTWMEHCISKNPRAGVKEITQYLALYRLLTGCDWDEYIETIFAYLISLRDETTGFIGRHDDPGWAMRGHRNNILVFTLYPMGLQEPIGHQKKIIRSTLDLQRPDGLFHDGGMCANMDAIQMLAEYSLQSGEYRQEVRESIQRAMEAIFEHLAEPEGGAHYEYPEPDNEGRLPAPQLVTGLGFTMESLRFAQCLDVECKWTQ